MTANTTSIWSALIGNMLRRPSITLTLAKMWAGSAFLRPITSMRWSSTAPWIYPNSVWLASAWAHTWLELVSHDWFPIEFILLRALLLEAHLFRVCCQLGKMWKAEKFQKSLALIRPARGSMWTDQTNAWAWPMRFMSKRFTRASWATPGQWEMSGKDRTTFKRNSSRRIRNDDVFCWFMGNFVHLAFSQTENDGNRAAEWI